MSLETADTIAQLVTANPTSSDDVSQGDNHLRLIKGMLKTQFPGAGGLGFNIPITPTEAELNFVEGAASNIQEQIDDLVIASGADALTAPFGTLLIFGNGFTPPGWTAVDLVDDYLLHVVNANDHSDIAAGTDNPIFYNATHRHSITQQTIQSGTGATVVDDVPMGLDGVDWSPRYVDAIVGKKD